MFTIMFTNRKIAVIVPVEKKDEVLDSIMEGNKQFGTACEAEKYARTFNIEGVEFFAVPEIAAEAYPIRTYKYSNVLRVNNLVERTLFENEVCGQISDGVWENTNPQRHWECWAEAQIVVDPKNVGRNFYADKDNYQLSRIMEYCGDRMKFYAELAMQFPTEIQACLDRNVRLPDNLADYDRAVSQVRDYASSARQVATWNACGLTREKVEYTSKNMLITDKDLRDYLRTLSTCMKTRTGR